MSFYSILVHIHSGFRWLVLVFILVSVFQAVRNLNGSHQHNIKEKIYPKFSMIFSHIQLLIGLVLYFISPKVVFSSSSMKDSLLRFFLVEHILLMIIALILITIGYIKHKKAADFAKKQKTLLIYYAVALLIILLAIPWPFRELGAGWF